MVIAGVLGALVVIHRYCGNQRAVVRDREGAVPRNSYEPLDQSEEQLQGAKDDPATTSPDEPATPALLPSSSHGHLAPSLLTASLT